jgi:hypothetical protein
MAENEICDHGVIAARASAELFGRYNVNLVDTDLKACADQVPPYISKGGLRGCNSEMILMHDRACASKRGRCRQGHLALGSFETKWKAPQDGVYAQSLSKQGRLA